MLVGQNSPLDIQLIPYTNCSKQHVLNHNVYTVKVMECPMENVDWNRIVYRSFC